MTTVKRSAADGPPRRARTDATRRRIVKAAFDLFCTRGYSGTTMAQIADASGVAVQTVYFAFHTKSAVLSRAYDFAVMSEDEPMPPDRQAWYRDMVAVGEPAEALRRFVVGAGEITRRLTPLYVVAAGSAVSDPEVAEIVDRHEKWRVEGYRGVLEMLRAKSPLSEGLSSARATDLLLLYVGMDVYHFLVEVAGWTHGEWVEWTTTTLGEQLFGNPGPHAGVVG